MIPILINKDVFEPSYNDLKFTIQNCNCFFINLIVCQRDIRIAHLLLQQTSGIAPKMTSAKISNVTGSEERFMPQRIVRSSRTICHQIVEPNSWVWNQKGRRDEGITERWGKGKIKKSPTRTISTADWGTVTQTALWGRTPEASHCREKNSLRFSYQVTKQMNKQLEALRVWIGVGEESVPRDAKNIFSNMSVFQKIMRH